MAWKRNNTSLMWEQEQTEQSGVDEEVETQGQDEDVEQVRADWVRYGAEENTEIKTQQN